MTEFLYFPKTGWTKLILEMIASNICNILFEKIFYKNYFWDLRTGLLLPYKFKTEKLENSNFWDIWES